MLKVISKANFSVICFLILFQEYETQDWGTIVNLITTGIGFLSKNFDQREPSGDIADFGAVALSVIKKIPDIIQGLDSLGTQNLDQIKQSLERIEALQQQTINDIKKLEAKLDTSVIQNVLAADGREIESCMESYERLLADPTNSALRSDMINCKGKLSHVRSVKKILNGSDSGGIGPLFEQIKKIYGYCDGRAVSELYEYLFRLLFQGYTAIAAAAELETANSSQTYISEYTTALTNIITNMESEFHTCAVSQPFCKVIGDNINRNLAMLDNLDRLISTLDEIAPYYKVFIFKLKAGSSYGISMTEANFGSYTFLFSSGTTLIYLMKSINTKDYNIRPIEDQNNVDQIESADPDKTECKMKISFNCNDLVSKHGTDLSLDGECSGGRQTWRMTGACLQADIKNHGYICREIYDHASAGPTTSTVLLCAFTFLWFDMLVAI